MKLTMKQMCEEIAKSGILKRDDGTYPTAEQIFNYSPTGELSRIFDWYSIVMEIKQYPDYEEKGE